MDVMSSTLDNQIMVNCWFGLVVWIPGFPLSKGLWLKGTLRIPNDQAQPTMNHWLQTPPTKKQPDVHPIMPPKNLYVPWGGTIARKISPPYHQFWRDMLEIANTVCFWKGLEMFWFTVFTLEIGVVPAFKSSNRWQELPTILNNH